MKKSNHASFNSKNCLFHFRFPSTFSSMSGIIKAVASSFNTELELKEVTESFFSVCNILLRHFLFFCFFLNSWCNSEWRKVSDLVVRNELLSSRSTGLRIISTGWDKIITKWWIGFNASTELRNMQFCYIFYRMKSPHFLPFYPFFNFSPCQHISHPVLLQLY